MRTLCNSVPKLHHSLPCLKVSVYYYELAFTAIIRLAMDGKVIAPLGAAGYNNHIATTNGVDFTMTTVAIALSVFHGPANVRF